MADEVTLTAPEEPVAKTATAEPKAIQPEAPVKAATAPAQAVPKAEAPAPKPDNEGEGNAVLAQQLQNAIIAGNIPQIVMYAITLALQMGASDVHIEPEEKTIRIRLRIDGVLRHIVEYPINIHPAVVSRVKIMSNLKIDEQRVPQDGRTQVTTDDGRSIDLRVSTLPTVNGEKIVMRLQDKTKTIPDLPDLGLKGTSLEIMEGFTKLPNGIILVTGPTGSGKTNTLYSILHRLNQVGVNIMTFEDPVEYQMDGLNQSQVRPDIEYDFSVGLRTALRQDPDIIMVGEIRDQETIEIAIRAALTGHLVLSTIHTNSAVSTLTRITDMGVKPFLITSSIRGIVSQRLVRRICEFCKEEYVPEAGVVEELKKELANISEKDLDPALLQDTKLYKGKGCEKCNDLGYKGRVAVFEILSMDREVGQLVLQSAPDAQLEEQAKKGGMITLRQDGF
ncbi:MAG: Flp pilus assembly complex ATPase component TadA, partial [Deltaproteobacteria bacterium]|nr:Flp pilus assembly complex ATPase component TadA [Deltaproteobacteria bacterium]